MKTSHVSLVAVVTIATISFVVGCSKEPAPQSATRPSTTPATIESDDGHGHGHGAGPHDGTLADWGGGKYHVEFTVDHDKQEATVYILGSDEKTPEPIKAEKLLLTINDPNFQTDLLPVPMEGEAEGIASRFVGTHESLSIVKEYSGTISAEVDGTPYAGNFTEQPHGSGGHAHTHGADDALVWEGESKSHAGLQILLGHHGKHLHAGEEVEPAVSITRDGEPVSDATVFNSLVSANGDIVLAKEVATVFEPTTEDEPAHYAQGGLAIPKDASKVIIRFRIELAGGDAVKFDVPIAVE